MTQFFYVSAFYFLIGYLLPIGINHKYLKNILHNVQSNKVNFFHGLLPFGRFFKMTPFGIIGSGSISSHLMAHLVRFFLSLFLK